VPLAAKPLEDQMKKLNGQKEAFQKHVNQRIRELGPAAREAMLNTGIPASFLLADYLIVSRFGTRRVALPFGVPLTKENVIEQLFGGPQDLWTHLLDKAWTIANNYRSLRGKKYQPIKFTRVLQALRYFGSNTADADEVIALVKRFHLTKWDRLSASQVRAAKDKKRRSDLHRELQMLCELL